MGLYMYMYVCCTSICALNSDVCALSEFVWIHSYCTSICALIFMCIGILYKCDMCVYVKTLHVG